MGNCFSKPTHHDDERKPPRCERCNSYCFLKPEENYPVEYMCNSPERCKHCIQKVVSYSRRPHIQESQSNFRRTPCQRSCQEHKESRSCYSSYPRIREEEYRRVRRAPNYFYEYDDYENQCHCRKRTKERFTEGKCSSKKNKSFKNFQSCNNFPEKEKNLKLKLYLKGSPEGSISIDSSDEDESVPGKPKNFWAKVEVD